MSKKKLKVTDSELEDVTAEEIEDIEYDEEELMTSLAEDVEAAMKEQEDGLDLDWKSAARKLKNLVTDQSIDTYFKRQEIAELRERYNSKERTEELFNLIMGV